VVNSFFLGMLKTSIGVEVIRIFGFQQVLTLSISDSLVGSLIKIQNLDDRAFKIQKLRNFAPPIFELAR